MTYLPHDLLRIDLFGGADVSDGVSGVSGHAFNRFGIARRSGSVGGVSVSRPDWLDAALARAPWVVVRRAMRLSPTADERAETIPVGVRGMTRSERHGMWIDATHVRTHVRPEALVATLAIGSVRTEDVPAMALARALVPLFQRFGLAWGPTGSVGFECASGARTAHASSDLDLIVRCDQVLPLSTAVALFDALERQRRTYGGCRIDATVETPFGAFALAEYAVAGGAFMLRTASGPRMVKRTTNDPSGGAASWAFADAALGTSIAR